MNGVNQMSDIILPSPDGVRELIEYEPRASKKNIILDATIFSTVMSCARLADFRFNHNLVSINGKANSLECGSIVHVFLEYFNRNIINGMKRDQAFGFGIAAAEMYIRGCPICTDFIPTHDSPKPECGHKPNEFPGVRNTPKDSADYKIGWQYVLDTCDQYHQFYRGDHWVPLEVEVVKGEVLYEDDEIRILWKAKLDLVCDTNQGIFPVDHKTMKQRRDTISLNNQFIGQCLIQKTRNVFIDKIGFQTTLKPIEKFTRPPVSYTAERLLEWQGETLPYYAKLLLMYAETGHFPPNYTHCESKYGNCQFVSVCESNPNMREEEIKRLFVVGPAWNPSADDND
jgi:hypothetical protein